MIDSLALGFSHQTAPSRRDVLMSSVVSFFPIAASASPDPRGTVTIHLEQGEQVGLELYDIQLNGKPLAAIRTIRPKGKASQNLEIKPGMLFQQDSKSIVELLKNGPYPIDLEIRNLAAGGDAFGDRGKPLVTAEDALDLATKLQDSPPSTSLESAQYVVRNLREVSSGIQSRRGDVLEIIYEAYMRSEDGVLYDSSEQRGTGRPYQFVLGSGDMISGVDLGCYNMRPGDARLVEIPPAVGYGTRGNKLFGIPGNTKLVWKIKCVRVNSVREGDERTRDEIEGRFMYE